MKFKHFVIGFLIVVVPMTVGTLMGVGLTVVEFEKQLKEKIIFCKECCWKNEFDGRAYYTCAETKEELWRKIP